jgi:hypothetical protein
VAEGAGTMSKYVAKVLVEVEYEVDTDHISWYRLAPTWKDLPPQKIAEEMVQQDLDGYDGNMYNFVVELALFVNLVKTISVEAEYE